MRVVLLALVLGATAYSNTNPIERVVALLDGLKSKIQLDGVAEQAVYDKYACWCESTTARKAAAISAGKTTIEELSSGIAKLDGRIGSFTAEITNLKKDIAENKESVEKATDMRTHEHEESNKKEAALQQAITNLDEAIDVLTDGTTNFSPAMMETRMLTVAAGVKGALNMYSQNNGDGLKLHKDDISHVKSFLGNPAAFLTSGSPHKGTYQTGSTAVQGILKEMYETFQRDVVSAQEEENQAQGDFDNLKQTKTQDGLLLTATLLKKNSAIGGDGKQLAEDTQQREETKAQLKTDEEFFATTQDNCKSKADAWATRSRLRTEELAGINQAVAILGSDDAQATFTASDTTFVQLSTSVGGPERINAYNILKKVATQSNNLRLAALASRVYTEGHFDKVIADIEKMIQTCRDEEKGDIAHRDWCESERNAATDKNEALEYDKADLTKKIERAEAAKTALEAEITQTESDISASNISMNEARDNRNAEHADFQQAAKDDSDAVGLIAGAIESLTAFSKNNGLALLKLKVLKVYKKHGKQDPGYKESEDTAPETFTDGGYGGRSSESGGLIMILEMIKEDVEKDLKLNSKEEKSADTAYRKQLSESHASMDAMNAKVASLNTEVAAKMKLIADTEAVHGDKDASKTAADDYLSKLAPNCDWIDRTFTTRQEQRKSEMAGLESAKSALAVASRDGDGSLVSTKAILQGKAPTIDDQLQDLEATEKSYGMSFLQRK